MSEFNILFGGAEDAQRVKEDVVALEDINDSVTETSIEVEKIKRQAEEKEKALVTLVDQTVKKRRDQLVYNLDAEIAKAPDRKIPGVDYVKAPLIQAYSGIRADYLTERYIKSASEREKAWLLSEYARIPVVRSMYQSMFTDKEALNTFGQIFRLIQSEEGTVLFHCTSGKDRTGVLSAMLLYVLGCDEKDIINDYNASAISFNAMSENHMELLKRYEYEEDVLIGLQSTLSVVPEAIREGLDRITSRYPAREMFAMEVLGMNEEEIDNFQNKFLTE